MKTNFEKCLKLHLAGDLTKAELGYRQLLLNNNLSSEIYCNLGIICEKTKREDEAIILFKKAIKLNSKSSIAYNNLGLIFLKKQKYEEAIKNFVLALEYKKNVQTYFYLAIIYEKIGKIKQSIDNYKKVIKIDNNNAEAFCNLGQLYLITGNLEEAINNINKSIKLRSDLDASFNNLGLVNMAYGNFKLAKKNFTKALKINPNNSKAHSNISSLINYNIEGKRHLNEMLKKLETTKSKQESINYCFALGKAYEDKREYKKSFKYFKNGNLIIRQDFSYSIEEEETLFKNIKKTFNSRLMLDFKSFGFEEYTPIFIVGMPRSGTSLIEQILASHPNVFGAGEINDLDDIIMNFFYEKKKIKSLKKLYNLNNSVFKSAGQKYCLKLKARSNNFKFITNKLPLNFKWIGLIKLILPKAIIIHCKRHPIDTSLSIFQQNFMIKGNEYSFNLNEIAQYYKLYMDLMIYWKKLIPNSFYEIVYENLINDQKKQTQKLLKYCKLSWNDNCLNFTKTNRAVRTASDIQVRRKIYKDSVNKWKKYKQELNLLKKTIESSPYWKNNYSYNK